MSPDFRVFRLHYFWHNLQLHYGSCIVFAIESIVDDVVAICNNLITVNNFSLDKFYKFMNASSGSLPSAKKLSIFIVI